MGTRGGSLTAEGASESAERNKALVRGLMLAARRLLVRPQGLLHVTLTHVQPSLWRIEDIAAAVGMFCLSVHEFSPKTYPGYTWTRGHATNGPPVIYPAFTFVFSMQRPSWWLGPWTHACPGIYSANGTWMTNPYYGFLQAVSRVNNSAVGERSIAVSLLGGKQARRPGTSGGRHSRGGRGHHGFGGIHAQRKRLSEGGER